MHKTDIPAKLNISESLGELTDVLEDFLAKNNARSILIINGIYAYNNLSKDLIKSLNAQGRFKIDCIDPQQINITNPDYDWVIGVGGGKVLDQAKYFSKLHNCKFISIPTLIAHDGICSPVAVIDGKSVGAVMPHALFVPLFIIKDSPLIHIRAGVGDLIANLSAIDDWILAAQVKSEAIDDFAIMLSKRSAINLIHKLELNLLRNNHLDIDAFLRSSDFLSTLTESLALSGIAMSISGNSRPCSGAEHMISHAIDQIYGHGIIAPHGIQVLVATLFLEQYRQASSLKSTIGDLNQFKNTLSSYGFPISFEDIGIQNNELSKILELAPQTRSGRYSILNKLQVHK